jgi:hypothetical protein
MRKPVVLKQREYATWVVFERDAEAQQWVAHCLTTDVMAQGDNLIGAQEALLKMISNVLHEAHKRGLNIYELPSASREAWDLRQRVANEGQPVAGGIGEVPAEANAVIAHYIVTWKLIITDAPQRDQRSLEDSVDIVPVSFGKNGANVAQLESV